MILRTRNTIHTGLRQKYISRTPEMVRERFQRDYAKRRGTKVFQGIQ
jgi:hypothetical protein